MSSPRHSERLLQNPQTNTIRTPDLQAENTPSSSQDNLQLARSSEEIISAKDEMVGRRKLEFQNLPTTKRRRIDGAGLPNLLAFTKENTPFTGPLVFAFKDWFRQENGPKKIPNSQITKQTSSKPKAHKPFERVCASDPVLCGILNQLSTPDIIALMWTSRTISHFVCSQTGANVFKEIVLVRDERWQLLAGIERQKRNQDPFSEIDEEERRSAFLWQPISPFFREVIEWVSHYRDMDSVEKRVQWAVDFKRQVERLQKSNALGGEVMEKVMTIAQGDRLAALLDISKWKLSELEDYLEVEVPQHLHITEPQDPNPFAAPIHAGNFSDLEEAAMPPTEHAFFTQFKDFSFNSYFSRLQFPEKITRIVLDGTAVTEKSLGPALRAVTGTLVFISTRNCKNLTAGVYDRWLEDAIFNKITISIKEINTFGAAGLEGRFLGRHALMNPLDFYKNGEIMPNVTKFAACMPLEDHAKHTLPLLIPQHFRLEDKLFIYQWMLYQLEKDIRDWAELREKKGHDPSSHFFPGGLILHEIQEQTRLMAMCSYLEVELDVNFCAGGRQCYTYRDQEKLPKISSAGFNGPSINFPPGFRFSNRYLRLKQIWNNPHPFNLTQRHRRREEGGMPCRVCGHFECKKRREFPGRRLQPGRWAEIVNSFPDAEARFILSKFGGINYNQDEIGWNRTSGTGEYCDHCVRNMSCSQCDAFFCMNCIHIQSNGIQNPWRLPVVPTTLLYHDVCDYHGPICSICAHVNRTIVICKVEQTNCQKIICNLCHPNGMSLVPMHRAMDPTLPHHIKEATRLHPSYSVIGDLISEITEMPERKKLRDYLEIAGCEEIVLYDRCDICDRTFCTDCQKTTKESFVSCYGTCGRKICPVCTASVCDTCDRSLCFQCAVHDNEERKQILVHLFPTEADLNPNDDDYLQACSRCIVKTKILQLELEGSYEFDIETQHPELFPDDYYEESEDDGSDIGEYEEGESSTSEDALPDDPDLTYNRELGSFVGGHIPKDIEDIDYDPLRNVQKKRPSRYVLVKTALDKLQEKEKIKLCRAIYICATLRPIMPFLLSIVQYHVILAHPEVAFYKHDAKDIKYSQQAITDTTYPKIVENLSNKQKVAEFVLSKDFSLSLHFSAENFKIVQKASFENNMPIPNPDFLRHPVLMENLLSYFYIRYDRTLIANMCKVPFTALPNDNIMQLVRHHYVYNESLLHAVKSDETDIYIDCESIIGEKLLNKYLHPETGIWRVNKNINLTTFKNKRLSCDWQTGQNARLQKHLSLWREIRRQKILAAGPNPSDYPDQLTDAQAEHFEAHNFKLVDMLVNPCPRYYEIPEEEEGAPLASVYEMPPISPGIFASQCILFHDYA